MNHSKIFVIKDGVLKKYSGSDKKFVILEGVTEIGEEAFAECINLESVSIPSIVSTI